MFKKLRFVVWHTGTAVRELSTLALRHHLGRQLADKFNEFVLRIRRAGMLFLIAVSGLLAFSLIFHPLDLLLWLVALPLAAFGSVLSLLWPTRRSWLNKPSETDLPSVINTALNGLARARRDIPPGARNAFDLVTQRLENIGHLAANGHDVLAANDARRLIGRHLPGLVNSFVSLPSADRTEARAGVFAEALATIEEEIADFDVRLRASLNDRFEIKHRFIASRFPRKGLGVL